MVVKGSDILDCYVGESEKNLAPGDFRTVRQEQFYLGGDVSNADRIAALKEECALKKDGDHTARIGF